MLWVVGGENEGKNKDQSNVTNLPPGHTPRGMEARENIKDDTVNSILLKTRNADDEDYPCTKHQL